MSSKTHFAPAAMDIVTRAELDSRINARPKPRLERHFTIGGTIERDVHTWLDAANESRIRTLQDRLERLRGGVCHDQAQARLTGKARSDFGRSQ